MSRYLMTSAIALSCAVTFGGTLGAQSHESKTKVKADHGKAITYTGCVQTGTATRTYVLQHVVPLAQTETTGTAGTMTETTYALIPDATVQLQEQVGQKVEVTGVLVPAGKGETKYKAKTKSQGSEQETEGKVERSSMTQLKVVSVRPLGQTCS